MNPVFYVAEIVLLVIGALLIAVEPAVIRLERKVIRLERKVIRAIRRYIRRKKTEFCVRKLECFGMSVSPAPAMTAEEVIASCNSLR